MVHLSNGKQYGRDQQNQCQKNDRTHSGMKRACIDGQHHDQCSKFDYIRQLMRKDLFIVCRLTRRRIDVKPGPVFRKNSQRDLFQLISDRYSYPAGYLRTTRLTSGIGNRIKNQPQDIDDRKIYNRLQHISEIDSAIKDQIQQPKQNQKIQSG